MLRFFKLMVLVSFISSFPFTNASEPLAKNAQNNIAVGSDDNISIVKQKNPNGPNADEIKANESDRSLLMDKEKSSAKKNPYTNKRKKVIGEKNTLGDKKIAQKITKKITKNAKASKKSLLASPEDILKDDENYTEIVNPYTGETSKGRKGSLAATLKNIPTLNKMIIKHVGNTELEQAVTEFSQLIDFCNAAGLFDLFSPCEWLSSRNQPGRVLAAIILLQKHPHKADREAIEILKSLQHDTPYNVIRVNAELAIKAHEQIGK